MEFWSPSKPEPSTVETAFFNEFVKEWLYNAKVLTVLISFSKL